MSDKLTSIEKAILIINNLIEDKRELSLAEMTERLSLPKTSLHRLCGILVKSEYLTKDKNTGKYRLGLKFLEICHIFQASSKSLDRIQTTLRELRDLLNETVTIYRISGNERKCIMRFESNSSLKHTIQIGQKLPLQLGAGGVVLLAYSSDAFIENYIKTTDLSPFYLHEDDLRNRAERVKKKGYEMSFAERDPFVAALAVPIFNGAGDFFGALSVSGPIERIRQNIKEEQVSVMKEFALRIKQLVDYL